LALLLAKSRESDINKVVRVLVIYWEESYDENVIFKYTYWRELRYEEVLAENHHCKNVKALLLNCKKNKEDGL